MSRQPTSSESLVSNSWRDWIHLHLVVLIWGVTGVIGKLIVIPSAEVVAWRTGLAAIGFAIFSRWLGASLRVPRAMLFRLLFVGALVGIHWILFFLSARISNVSVCMVAMPTIMIWCSLLEPLFDRSKRISKLELLTGAIMIGAVWLIFRAEFSHGLGFTVGLVSAFFSALFVLMSKGMVLRHHFATVSFYEMIGACLISIIAIPFFDGMPSAWSLPCVSDLLWLLVLSMVCTVGAYGSYMDLLRRMPVFTLNVVYNLEPVYGIVLAALVFGSSEIMSVGFYFGTTIIIGTVIFLPLLQRHLRNA